jgi:hypothetical protein
MAAKWKQDISAPRHFVTVEKKCQIGTTFSFKYKMDKNWQTRAWDPVFKTAGSVPDAAMILGLFSQKKFKINIDRKGSTKENVVPI